MVIKHLGDKQMNKLYVYVSSCSRAMFTDIMYVLSLAVLGPFPCTMFHWPGIIKGISPTSLRIKVIVRHAPSVLLPGKGRATPRDSVGWPVDSQS